MADVTISYKGNSIATMSASGTKTLLTEGKYCEDDITVAYTAPTPSAGSATTPATTITANPTITVSTSGLITATASASQSITPTVVAGYVSAGTAGTVSVSGSNTKQLTAKAAATYTPTTADQTIASGQYLTGAQTIKGDANLLAENIKDGVTIFGVTGTYTGGSATRTVSISLTNPLNPDGFSDGTIYEMLSSDPWDINNPILDRLNSPTSSGTYTIGSTSYGINVVLEGVSIYTGSATCVCTGGADLADNYGYGFVFTVSADGTINIDGVNYDD